MEPSIPTRVGDGALMRLTPAEIEAAIRDGVAVAIERTKVEPLSEDEIAHLLHIPINSVERSRAMRGARG